MNLALQVTLVVVFTGQAAHSLDPPTQTANILFFLPHGSASHRLAQQPLGNSLARRGHNVTFLVQEDVTKIKGNDPRVKFVSAKKVMNLFATIRGGSGLNFYHMRATEKFGGGFLRNLFVHTFGLKTCENLYSDPEVMEWLQSTPKFDLIIIDTLFNECGYGLAHKHNAKTMIFSVSTVLPWVLDPIGMPDESAWVPDVMLGVPLNMNFINRVYNAIMPVFWRIFREWYYFPKLEQISREGLKDANIPSFAELERNTSLTLVNTHAAQELPRAWPPNVIPVGGMSWLGTEKQKPLPKEMTEFINEGKEGFIYVSFGSFIDFLTFPEEVQQTFINVLKQFPNIQFIWKLNKTPKNLPKNILVQPWMPQQDILLHPKIRAFITHSGIGGVNEAIYTSVPLICFPLFSEQDYNAQLVERRGFGIKMEITALTVEDMVQAIRKIMSDASYKENAKKVTQQFLDRPMNPVDTAVWYTEFVLRQESTEYLRSQNVDQFWWRKRQLDVWLFVLLVTISLNSLGLYIFYKILKRCFGSKSKNLIGKSGKGKQKKN